MNMILSTSQMLFPLITLPYASRILQTYGMGLTAFAQSVLSYFSLVALLGMQTYGVKACAEVRDDPKRLAQTVKELLTILLISTTIVFIVYIVAVLFIPRFAEDRFLFLMFSVGIWLVSFGAEWFYQAIEQYGYITIRNVIFKIIGIVLMVLLVRDTSDYNQYGFVILFSGYGMNILNIIRLRKLVNLSLAGKPRIRHHFKKMVWYMMASVSSGMYIQTDIVALGFMGTPNMVGIYQLAAKIKNVLIQALNSVGSVILPRMSYIRAKKDEKAITKLLADNISFIGILSGLLIGGTVICADSIVQIMGGSGFSDSALPLIVAMPAILFSPLNIIFGNELITESREKEWAIINVITLACSFVFAFALIPLIGVCGAALTNVLTELTSLIMRWYRSRAFFGEVIPHIEVLKIVGCAIISIAVMLAFKHYVHLGPGFAALLLYGSLFTLIYILLLFIFKEQFFMRMIRSVAGKFRR
ncbi:flippase [Bifidobacterium animalis]|uniref:flippase n=1 Tax=Bifidobacterium animalis TaxID=28025 RepID=UPI0006A55441|nr:flippase [Bifidobacterium animalis]KOA54207.1 hypothetical protein BAAA27672_07140 [Bifidobacterium animalis subsp. animalis ATCC 27672]